MDNLAVFYVDLVSATVRERSINGIGVHKLSGHITIGLVKEKAFRVRSERRKGAGRAILHGFFRGHELPRPHDLAGNIRIGWARHGGEAKDKPKNSDGTE